ncbi:MAG: GntR family transcriptional regulator [Alphaproteobacteria bacterium]|nr:GntR family transcriptional regulator [Alphaproteobacteria bacterium]
MASKNATSAIRVIKDKRSLRELTTQALRDAILKMDFLPGQRLVERHLCELTGVSRTSVREAIQHLESEGLVERIGNRSLRVASVTVEEARQVYQVRAALESEFMRLFVERATDKDIRALRDALARTARTLRSRSLVAYVQALDFFFEVILRGARNDVAVATLRTLRTRISYLRSMTTEASTVERERETVERMRDIVTAVAGRDGHRAAKLCRAFVDRSTKFAIEVLQTQERRLRLADGRAR